MSDEAVKLEETGRDDKGRFLPGHEGMGGRPSISITSMIKARLAEVPPGQIKTYAEQIVGTLLEKAIVAQDVTVLKEIWHYIDGMPNQKVDFGVDKENIGELTAFLQAVAKKPENANNQPSGTDGGTAQ